MYKKINLKFYSSTLSACVEFWNNYKSSNEDRKNTLVFPIKTIMDGLHGLPPTLIFTANMDAFRDEGEEYARKFTLAVVIVSSMKVLHTLHIFILVPDLFCEETYSFIDSTVDYLCRIFVKQMNEKR